MSRTAVRVSARQGNPSKETAEARLNEAMEKVAIAEVALSLALADRDEAVAKARRAKVTWPRLMEMTGLSQPTLSAIVKRVLGELP